MKLSAWALSYGLPRRFMDPIERGPLPLHQPTGHGLVGEEHELLDELVGLVVVEDVDASDAAALIESDLRLREVELE